MIQIWEVENILSEFPDSRELKVFVGGVEVPFEIRTGDVDPEIRVELNGVI